jgi:flagellar L-ring protein precursor FlgH
MRRAVLFTVLALAPLAACASVREAVKGPQLSPMTTPKSMTSQDQLVSLASMPQPTQQAASPNSLWRSGARAFFKDQRAARVGDILTVLITINDNAKTSNATAASRVGANTAGATNLFGLEKVVSRVFNPAAAVNTSSNMSNTGTGTITREEQINLTVAAVVTSVLPNGNLVIQGRQEVKTNADVRELTVAGIVRPEDITSSNTINHTQIAEARINYGGRGDLSDIQKTPAGTALLEHFVPF